jgi:hypothetical protein
MIALAWLLVALLVLVGFVAWRALAEETSTPSRWLRGAIGASGTFFAVIAALLLWQALVHAGGPATRPAIEPAQAAQASMAVAPDPFAAQGPAIPAEGRASISPADATAATRSAPERSSVPTSSTPGPSTTRRSSSGGSSIRPGSTKSAA